jgi:hypothetical protein
MSEEYSETLLQQRKRLAESRANSGVPPLQRANERIAELTIAASERASVVYCIVAARACEQTMAMQDAAHRPHGG